VWRALKSYVLQQNLNAGKEVNECMKAAIPSIEGIYPILIPAIPKWKFENE